MKSKHETSTFATDGISQAERQGGYHVFSLPRPKGRQNQKLIAKGLKLSDLIEYLAIPLLSA